MDARDGVKMMDGFARRTLQKKTKILETALTLFLEYGIQKVAVAKIAKEAEVSQVTIYNYFENKQNLIREVIHYYVDAQWKEYEELLATDLPFPEKIKQIIFNKKEVANQIHEDFYQYLMADYASGNSYIESLYEEKAIPRFVELFEQGRAQGYIDPDLSNESLLFYIQMLKDYLQREDIYRQVLPMTEDLMKLLFYGITGQRDV